MSVLAAWPLLLLGDNFGDFTDAYKGSVDERQKVRLARWGVIGFGVIAYFLARRAEGVFALVEEASAFFEAGAVGYSARREAGRFDGIELRCEGWKVERLEVDQYDFVTRKLLKNPPRVPLEEAAVAASHRSTHVEF